MIWIEVECYVFGEYDWVDFVDWVIDVVYFLVGVLEVIV